MQPTDEELEKWRDLQERAESDFRLPEIQRLAKLILEICGDNRTRQAKLAFAMSRDLVDYQTDIARVGHEDFDTPDHVWRRGVDDCDGKARLFVALCRALGFEAGLYPKWEPSAELGGERLAHVAGGVNLGDGKGFRHAEPILARAQLGDIPARVPKEPNGHWRY